MFPGDLLMGEMQLSRESFQNASALPIERYRKCNPLTFLVLVLFIGFSKVFCRVLTGLHRCISNIFKGVSKGFGRALAGLWQGFIGLSKSISHGFHYYFNSVVFQFSLFVELLQVTLLRESDAHPHVIRYFCMVSTRDC